MEKISEMIERMCPEGVEFELLSALEDRGDITLGRGKVISKTEIRDNPGTYPVYSSSSQNDGKIGEYGKYMFDDERITWSIDGGGILFYRNNHRYSVTNVGGWIKVNTDTLSTRFLYFCLYQQWMNKVFDYTHKAHPSVIRNEYVVPVIPLSIQQEIVRILDSFTSMITNLETELASRQKQYEHYRNKLLTFDENDESVEWKTLGDIGTVVRGNGLQKTDFSEEGVGCVHYGQIYTRLGFSIDKTLTFVPEELAEKLTQVEPGNLIIACTSENVEDVCKSVVWLGTENIVTGGHACVFKHNENPKYVGYCFLTNDFFYQKKKYAYGAKVIDIKTEKLALIKIPVPKRSLQDDIVEKLDNFEALICNIKQELEARKKQYEYYREQLLTFE